MKLAVADLNILNVLAQFETRTHMQVAILAGYAPKSGGFMGSLAKLRREGLITGPGSAIQITEAGRAAAGPIEPLPSGIALLDYWKNKLPTAEGRILEFLVWHHPDPITHAELAEQLDYAPKSGGYMGALAKLRKLDLIEGPGTAILSSPDMVG